MNQELVKTETKTAMERAVELSKTEYIPEPFRGKPNECLIAVEMADRTGFAPFAVLQNLYVVYGKPAWGTPFIIGVINASSAFSRINYKVTGKKGFESYGRIAYATDLKTGEVLEGPEVTLAMAKAEGWVDRKGSKWRNMPELMLCYRAATLWARLYAPEYLMGLHTDDEIIDVSPVVTETRNSRFDKPLLESEPQTPPPPPPQAPKKEEKDLTQDTTLFKEVSAEEMGVDIMITDWIKHNCIDAHTLDEFKEACVHAGVKYGAYLLNNDAQGAKTVLQYMGKGNNE